ncbi:hypothetical protein ACOKFD_03055 [Flagellimonas sp. S174]|uniref:hypothetical protein n=1 Tax=Flagellimonas sp. S174 TaxID=3410790 RepID=UPI003BF59B33
MRTTLFIILLGLFSISPAQEVNGIRQVEGVYLGYVEGGYSFCSKTEPGMEEIVVFDEILSVILEKYPLHTNEHVGKNFRISFIKTTMGGKDGREGISTILRLQKVHSRAKPPEIKLPRFDN